KAAPARGSPGRRSPQFHPPSVLPRGRVPREFSRDSLTEPVPDLLEGSIETRRSSGRAVRTVHGRKHGEHPGQRPRPEGGGRKAARGRGLRPGRERGPAARTDRRGDGLLEGTGPRGDPRPAAQHRRPADPAVRGSRPFPAREERGLGAEGPSASSAALFWSARAPGFRRPARPGREPCPARWAVVRDAWTATSL